MVRDLGAAIAVRDRLTLPIEWCNLRATRLGCIITSGERTQDSRYPLGMRHDDPKSLAACCLSRLDVRP